MSAAGLRERKKMRTRSAIQKQALRLFLAKGYDETTIEEIAGAADISPSTFFNYYPSKEAVVFEDEYDPVIIAAFNAQPDATTNPIHALRTAMRQVFANVTSEQTRLIQQRTALMARTPELRSAMLTQFTQLADQIADLLADRAGKPRDDFAVHNLAGALLGSLMAVMIMVMENPKADPLDLLDRSLAHLEAGLPIDWP